MSYLVSLGKAIPAQKRKKLVFLSVLSLVSASLQTLNVALLIPFLASISNPIKFLQDKPYLEILNINQSNLILVSCLLFMVLCTVSGVTRVQINNYSNYISADIGCCLSDKINSYVESQPYSWHVRNNSSNVISTLTNNLNQTLNLIKTLSLFVPNILLIIVLFGSLIALEPKVIGFVVIMMSSFYYFIFKINEKKVVQIGRDRRLYHNIMIKWVQVLLSSIKSIKIEHNSDFFLDKISKSNRVYRESIVKNKIIQETPKFLIEPFFITTVLIIIIAYDYHDLSVQKLTEPLALLAFGFSKLIQPIQQIFQTFNSIKNNKPATEAVLSMVGTKNQLVYPTPKENMQTINLTGESLTQSRIPLLSTSRLSYKYDMSERYILQILTCIYKGETIGLVETGSGKAH